MLNVHQVEKKRRLAQGLASFSAAIALVFSLAFGTSSPAFAIGKPINDDLQAAQISTGEQKAATVLIYLNGSDLESQGGAASADIDEMLASGIGANANVVIETLGTKEWQDHGISSDHTQRYLVNQGKLELVDDSLGQLDTTSADTLADFISWGVENYPADRYMLIMWDHGAGPVYGFGVDEFQEEGEALTLDEIREALDANANVHFDFIGMDCCIMSSLETCYAFVPYCDYAILSEDFEPGIGWSYESWMAALENDPTVSTEDLGKVIVNDMVNTAEEDVENGGDATLAIVDESAVPALYEAWIAFAYENEDVLIGTNYSQEVSQHGRDGFELDASEFPRPSGHSGFGGMGFDDGSSNHGHHGTGNNFGMWGEPEGSYGYDDYSDYYGFSDYDNRFDFDAYSGYEGWESCEDGSCFYDEWGYVSMSDYYVTDIMVAASSADSDKADALEQALSDAIVYFDSTSGETGMTGIAVTLPYGDAEFYNELVDVFSNSGIDAEYIAWLENFVHAEGANSYYDYGEFEDDWSGWDSFFSDRHDRFAYN